MKQGFVVLYYSVDECADDVRRDLKVFGWDIAEFEKDGKFHFIDVFSRGAEALRTSPGVFPDECIDAAFNLIKLLKEGQDFCLIKMAEKDLLIVLESVSPLLTPMDQKDVFKFLQTMKFIISASRSIGIAIMDLGIHDPKLEESCKQVVDTIIEFRSIEETKITKKHVRISKTSGSFCEGLFPLRLARNKVLLYIK